MKRSLPKIWTASVCTLSTLVGGYYLWKSQVAMGQIERDIRVAAQAAVEQETEETGGPVAIASLDEIFAAVGGREREPASHTLGMRLDLELFCESDRTLLDSRSAGVKDAILQAALGETYQNLTTVSGKLFFKEELVSRLNEFFNKPVVRDIHFGSFYLQ